VNGALVSYSEGPAFKTIGTGGNSIPGSKSGGGVKLPTHLHVVPRSRMVELYFLLCLNGVVLKYINKYTDDFFTRQELLGLLHKD
jgi:hypothetical protein